MQGEIGRVGAGVPGATALNQRTEMRDDDIHMICTYGHREMGEKTGDRGRVGLLRNLIQASGLLGDLIREIPAFESCRQLGGLIQESLESKNRDRDRRVQW